MERVKKAVIRVENQAPQGLKQPDAGAMAGQGEARQGVHSPNERPVSKQERGSWQAGRRAAGLPERETAPGRVLHGKRERCGAPESGSLWARPGAGRRRQEDWGQGLPGIGEAG